MSASEERITQLEAEVARLSHELSEYRKLYELSREEVERLRRGLMGQKAERLPESVKQLSFHILSQMLEDREVGVPSLSPLRVVKEHRRCKPTGRKPLPENLPTVRIELRPPEVECEPDAYECIGEALSEVLERRPASMVRVQVARLKFVRKDRQRRQPTRVLVAAPPEQPIPKGLAGPGMLADTIVRRWDDHAPLNRLERIYRRDGIALARSTLCGWHEQLAALARPVIKAMFEDALRQPYLCTDATGVLVQAKGECRKAHFWVLVAPERHVLFRYSHRHDSQAVDALLAGYEGFLVADAHVVYDHLYADGRVVESGCWSHTRRYFHKALQSDPDRAAQALVLIGRLFSIERTIANSPRKKREAVRQVESAPVVRRFFDWCQKGEGLVLDDTPISQGIGYALRQQEALSRFLDDGRLPIHNNVSERELRREVVGRKNWLFVGSDDGAVANTTFVTLLASCRLHGIEPWAYLRDILCLLPDWPARRALELAPAYWEQTLEKEDTQRQLGANPFRKVTLMEIDTHDAQT